MLHLIKLTDHLGNTFNMVADKIVKFKTTELPDCPDRNLGVVIYTVDGNQTIVQECQNEIVYKITQVGSV